MNLLESFLGLSYKIALNGVLFTEEPNPKTNGGHNFVLSKDEIDVCIAKVPGGTEMSIPDLLAAIFHCGAFFAKSPGKGLVVTANPNDSENIRAVITNVLKLKKEN